MNPETLNLIRDLAAKLGTTAEYLWPKLVGHVKSDALIGIIFSSASAGLGLLVVLVILWFIIRLGRSGRLDGESLGGMIIGGAVAISLTFVSLWALSENIPTYLYPEAKAINRLLGR